MIQLIQSRPFIALLLFSLAHYTTAGQINLNTAGGQATDGSDGLTLYVMDNGQLQIGYKTDRNTAPNIYSLFKADTNTESDQLFNGVYLALGTQVTGPDSFNDENSITNINEVSDGIWAEVSQTQSGSGSVSDPYIVTTTLFTTSDGNSIYDPNDDAELEIQTIYTVPNGYFLQRVTVTPPSGNTDPIKYFHSLDTFLSGGDNGPAFSLPTSVATSGSGNPNLVGVRKDPGGPNDTFVGFVEKNGEPEFSHWYSDAFVIHGTPGGIVEHGGSGAIKNGTDLPDTWNTNAATDNLIAIQFDLGAITTATTFEYFIALSGEASIDLDGNDSNGQTGSGYTRYFPTGSIAATPIADSDAQIQNIIANIEELQVTLTNPQTGDSLSVNPADLPANISVKSQTSSEIILEATSGSDTDTVFSAALQEIRFQTSSTATTPIQRIFNVTITNELGTEGSPAVTRFISQNNPTVNSLNTNDTTPVLTGTIGSSALTTGESLNITVGGATYNNVTVDGSGNWSLDTGVISPATGSLSLNANGSNEVVAQLEYNGTAGFSDTSSNELTIDTTAPTTVPLVNAQITNDTTPVITGTAGSGSLPAGESLTVIVGGATYTNVAVDGSGNWSLDTGSATPASGSLSLNTNGSNEVMARVVDNVGNNGSNDTSSNEITIDTTAPTTVPTVNAQITNDTTPVITGTAGSGSLPAAESLDIVVGGATYTNVAVDGSGNWSLDTGSATTASGSLSLNTNGSNEVVATVRDAANNTRSDTSNNELVIDTTDPVLPTINPLTTNDFTPELTGTAGSGSLPAGETLSISVGGATYNNVPVNSSGNWSLDTGTATPDSGTFAPNTNGANDVVATTRDAANNSRSDITTDELVLLTVSITINIVAGDDLLSLQELVTPLTISGTSQNIENGRTISLGLNGNTYNATVSSNSWSTTIPVSDLTALPASSQITANGSTLGGLVAPQATRNISKQLDDDGDGIANSIEVILGTDPNSNDTDKDGIPDSDELGSGGTASPRDTDGDGVPDIRDGDDDNDGIPTRLEDRNSDGDNNPATNTPANDSNPDGDSQNNYLDADSDGDGIPDAIENGNGSLVLDVDNDGIPDSIDADKDGTPGTDSGVTDTDNDGIIDNITLRDTDSDGIPDYLDADSDNDGLADSLEADVTGVADGLPASFTGGIDSNNDGINDSVLTTTDTDGDGLPDRIDLDSDNDSLTDTAEAGLLDNDQDGLADSGQPLVTNNPRNSDGADQPDFRDLDSNNDGNFDIEGTTNSSSDTAPADGRVDGSIDNDRDGIRDSVDSDPMSFGLGSDDDGDLVMNSSDLDDDNDGIIDSLEANPARCDALLQASSTNDCDGDSTINQLDTDSDNDGISDQAESGLPTLSGNDSDNDGLDDILDVDQTGGVDANSDGLDDRYTLRDTDKDGLPDFLDSDSDGDGYMDALENGDFNRDGISDHLQAPEGVKTQLSGGPAGGGASLVFFLLLPALLRRWSKITVSRRKA